MCLAVPGRLLEISREDEFFRSGRVDFGGIVKEVNLACVPEAKANDFVLVHVGMALAVLDEAEAAEVFAYVRALNESDASASSPANRPR